MLLAVLVLPVMACFGGNEGGGRVEPTASATGVATPASTAAPSTPTPPPWPVAAVLPEKARARITTDNLNVRVAPSTNSAAIGLLQPGDDIAIAGRSSDGQWRAIVNTGWTVYRRE